MHSFNKASNFSVHTLNQTEIRTDNLNGFRLLQDHMVPDATHDAGERYDAPKCHPDTRVAVLNNIRTWVDSNNGNARVMWLHGPAGAGKSAIAQTTADNCHKNNKLAASFFFSRAAGRSKKKGFVATIAYQLCVSIPAAREHIINTIEKNPKIFKSNVKAQFQSLVIDPMNLVYEAEEDSEMPSLIIIDGLDECEYWKNQVEIIEAIFHALSTEHNTQLRILLVSRPELEIRQAFNSDRVSRLCTRLALDDTFDPDKDIELYLRSQFQTIQRRHILCSTFPGSWPSDDIIRQIVEKSSGQFIYASTVIQFVSDAKRDPRKRLATILDINPQSSERPLAQLDAFYYSVLSFCEDYQNVASIFEAIMFLNRRHVPVDGDEILKSSRYLNVFLSLEEDVLLYLANLHSIVDVTNVEHTGIKFYHASFYDFLVDPSRSKEFYIDKNKAHARLAIRCLEFVESNAFSGLPNIVYAYCFGCCFCHYRNSNWDESVLDYILRRGILKPHNGLNSVMQSAFRTFFSQPYTESVDNASMLGHLIYVAGERDSLRADTRAIIDHEVFDQLKQCPTDVMILFYFRSEWNLTFSLKSDCLPWDTTVETAAVTGHNSIFDHDLIYNFHTMKWFSSLMTETGYFSQMPEDIKKKSICRILEIIAIGEVSFSEEVDLEDPSNDLSMLNQTISSMLSEMFKDIFVPGGTALVVTILEMLEHMGDNAAADTLTRDKSSLFRQTIREQCKIFLAHNFQPRNVNGEKPVANSTELLGAYPGLQLVDFDLVTAPCAGSNAEQSYYPIENNSISRYKQLEEYPTSVILPDFIDTQRIDWYRQWLQLSRNFETSSADVESQSLQTAAEFGTQNAFSLVTNTTEQDIFPLRVDPADPSLFRSTCDTFHQSITMLTNTIYINDSLPASPKDVYLPNPYLEQCDEFGQ